MFGIKYHYEMQIYSGTKENMGYMKAKFWGQNFKRLT